MALMRWQKSFKDQLMEDAKQIAESGRCNYIGIVLVGPPGTGKSYALNDIVSSIKSLFPLLRIAMTATTGAASTRLHDATTLATFLSIGGDSMKLHLIDEILPIIEKRSPARITQTDILIIDEVSMFSMTHYNNLDICLRHVRNDPRPFGGMYIIFVGDPFQLPPVPQDSGGGVARNTRTFVESCLEGQNAGFRYVVANEMKRSEESSLLQNTLLQTISESPTDRNNANATLRKHCYVDEMTVDDVLDYQQETGATILSPAREGEYSVAHYNQRARSRAMSQPGYEEIPISPVKKIHDPSDKTILKAIGGERALASEEKALESRDSWTIDPFLSKNLPYMVRMKVKCGEKTLVNGDIVEVLSLNPDESVNVFSFRFKEKMTITRQSFTSEWYPEIGYEGYPLLPCSAMTIHKAQGATLESGIIFEVRRGYADEYLAHMWYTAFSRVKRIEDIRLTSYIRDLLDHPKIQKKLGYVWKLPYMNNYLRPI
jgi:ATP-dependent exoDNAse (exonuclease V) alpha subunit